MCRFCQAELPDWREGVTPEGLRPASPVMSIHHNGETYMVRIQYAAHTQGRRADQEAGLSRASPAVHPAYVRSFKLVDEILNVSML